jgi:acetyl-CoA C-acetyltransferase
MSYIIGYARTPIGAFGKSLANITAVQLGTVATIEAIKRAKINPGQVEEAFYGNVLQANLGQAPCRQVCIHSKIPNSVICTTVNKVCASALKSIMLGSGLIQLGQRNCVLAGGMESMSRAPYLLADQRFGSKFGGVKAIDSLEQDGLFDVYDKSIMGMCVEKLAKEFKLTRAEMDDFAEQSHLKCRAADKAGLWKREITPVMIKGKKGDEPMLKDEAWNGVNLEKLRTLKPAFSKDGVLTAGSSSPISDGAASLILASKKFIDENGIKPIAKIMSYADHAMDPYKFPIAPADAVKKAVALADLKMDDIDAFELNEAFALVGVMVPRLLKINPAKVNKYGGALALGHPLGCSGARIVCTLLNVLENEGLKFGAVGICNGGGGASAMVVKKL